MNKVVVGTAVVAVVAVAGVGVAAWSGPKVADELEKQTEKVLQSLPGARLIEQHVTKGLFSSTHEVTFQIGCPPAAAAAAGAAGAASAPASEPFQVTVRDRIQHGPLPGGKSFGLAAVDSEVVLPPKATEALARVFGKQQPFQIRTVVGFGGGYVTDVTSPAVKFSPEADDQIDWQGAKLTVRGNLKGGMAAGGSYSLELPGLAADVQSDKAGPVAIKVGRVAVNGEVLPGDSASLWMRPSNSKGSIASVEFIMKKGGDAKPFAVRADNLQFSGQGKLDQGLMTQVGEFSGTAQIGEFKVDKVEFKQTLSRVHAATYEKMMSGFFKQASSCNKPADAPALESAATDELAKGAGELLRHDPAYSVDKLSIEIGGQRAELSYGLGVRGVTEAEAAAPAIDLLGTKVHANADLKVQTGWIEQVAKGVAATQMAQQKMSSGDTAASQQTAQATMMAMANVFIDQGVAANYVVRDGDAIKASAKFEAGLLQLNGRPIPLPLPGLNGRR